MIKHHTTRIKNCTKLITTMLTGNAGSLNKTYVVAFPSYIFVMIRLNKHLNLQLIVLENSGSQAFDNNRCNY